MFNPVKHFTNLDNSLCEKNKNVVQNYKSNVVSKQAFVRKSTLVAVSKNDSQLGDILSHNYSVN